jgi:hypothetical protein
VPNGTFLAWRVRPRSFAGVLRAQELISRKDPQSAQHDLTHTAVRCGGVAVCVVGCCVTDCTLRMGSLLYACSHKHRAGTPRGATAVPLQRVPDAENNRVGDRPVLKQHVIVPVYPVYTIGLAREGTCRLEQMQSPQFPSTTRPLARRIIHPIGGNEATPTVAVHTRRQRGQHINHTPLGPSKPLLSKVYPHLPFLTKSTKFVQTTALLWRTRTLQTSLL